MGGGYGSGISNSLWGIVIRRSGTIVGSVDSEHSLLYSPRSDQSVICEVIYQPLVATSRTSPGHASIVGSKTGPAPGGVSEDNAETHDEGQKQPRNEDIVVLVSSAILSLG